MTKTNRLTIDPYHDITARLRAGLGIVALVILALGTMNARAGETGKQDFDQLCARCHGKDGKGQGDFVAPGAKPTDLTKLARSNGGVFPREQVYQSIDGRDDIPAHSRFKNMPFWGANLQQEGKEFTAESEAKVKERISNIVSYIESMQEK
jgi:hypothetical protein